MSKFSPIGNASIDAKEYADYVFYEKIDALITKMLSEIEESGISAERAKLVPDFLRDAIEERNKMALTVAKFTHYPERKADGQWRR